MGKNSSAQKALRVAEVLDMIIVSKSTATIIKIMIEKYGVNRPTVDRYIKAATLILRKQMSIKKTDKINRALAQREHIIEKLMDVESYAVAAQALSDKNKLEDLYSHDEVATNVVIKVIRK